jgi:hypothetical protein
MFVSIKNNAKLTSRQQYVANSSKNYNIYAEDNISKNAPLLAVWWS